MKIVTLCAACRGANITYSANTTWNVEEQRFEIAGQLDDSFCEDCQEEEPDLRDFHVVQQENKLWTVNTGDDELVGFDIHAPDATRAAQIAFEKFGVPCE